MRLTYTICDHCGGSIPEGSGAVVNRHTESGKVFDTMHLCPDCCDKLLTSPKKPQEKMEGNQS